MTLTIALSAADLPNVTISSESSAGKRAQRTGLYFRFARSITEMGAIPCI